MADWQKIKTEYITTDTSYRKLAQKYELSQSQLRRVGKQENWVALRRQHLDSTLGVNADAVSRQQADRAAKLITVSDLLLARVKSLLEEEGAALSNTQSMKHLSGVLKDIKEIQMIRSDADIREQEARIAKLLKQAEKEEQEQTEAVTITIAGGDPSWQL